MPSTNYNPSTIERVGDLKRGLLVETTDVSYLSWGVGVQAELFTVYNRIIVCGLWGEVGAVDLVGAGCLHLFNWTSSVPVVAVQPICAVGTSIHAFVRGRRFSLPGTAVATAEAVTASAGISYHNVEPNAQMILGVAPSATVTSVSTIGCLTSIAVLTAGSARFSLLYVPLDTGAYAEARL